MARLSNETLAKTLSSTIFDLQKELKKDRKSREEMEEEIRNQVEKVEKATSHFKPDLSDFDESMDNHVAEMNRAAKKVENDYLTGKAIGIYFGTIILLGLFSFFSFHQQSKKTEDVRAEKEYYKQFILESEERTADFKKWAK